MRRTHTRQGGQYSIYREGVELKEGSGTYLDELTVGALERLGLK